MISIQLSEYVSQLLEAPLNPHPPTINSPLNSKCIRLQCSLCVCACVCAHVPHQDVYSRMVLKREPCVH